MNPFAALGLPADPDLTDEQVRAAWRTIAAATHPDRPDGGDPARYAVLRDGRHEHLATPVGNTAMVVLSRPPATEGADAKADPGAGLIFRT